MRSTCSTRCSKAPCALLDAHPEIRRLNVGGGLGVRMTESDVPIDLERWAAIIARHAVPRGLRVAVEPGDYLVKDAGLLLVQVNTVEDKAGTRFVGVDAGLGILNLCGLLRHAVRRRAAAGCGPARRASA